MGGKILHCRLGSVAEHVLRSDELAVDAQWIGIHEGPQRCAGWRLTRAPWADWQLGRAASTSSPDNKRLCSPKLEPLFSACRRAASPGRTEAQPVVSITQQEPVEGLYRGEWRSKRVGALPWTISP